MSLQTFYEGKRDTFKFTVEDIVYAYENYEGQQCYDKHTRHAFDVFRLALCFVTHDAPLALECLKPSYLIKCIVEQDTIHTAILSHEDGRSNKEIIALIKFLLDRGAEITEDAVSECVWFSLEDVLDVLLKNGGREIYNKLKNYDTLDQFVNRSI